MKVAIAGGGLAGLSCAVELIEAGAEVTILESEPLLGGKATSWIDEDGDTIETGLHVIPRRYETLLALLDRAGAADNLIWSDPHYGYVAPDGSFGEVRMAGLPAPLHVLAAVAGYDHLRWRDRISGFTAIGTTMVAGRRARDRLDDLTMADWMRRRGATQRFIDYTLDPGAKAFTFLDAEHVSAKSMYYWLRNYVKGREASRVAVVDHGMGPGMIAPLAEHVAAAGGEIRLESAVGEILVGDRRAGGFRMTSGETVEADAYVSAVPVHVLRRILPEAAREGTELAALRGFEAIPVVSVQLWFDRKLTDFAGMMMFVDGVASVFADLSNLRAELRARGGSMMELVLSPAAELIDRPDEEIVAMVLADLRSAFAPARDATVTKAAVVRIAESIYGAYPGMERLRPGTRTTWSNLVLCGDYVSSGLPPGMEAAAVSGADAARALLAGV